jgi:hypothetical protein
LAFKIQAILSNPAGHTPFAALRISRDLKTPPEK